MEESSVLLTSLITGIRRSTVEDNITYTTVDSLLTLAERLLRVFVILLAVSSADVGMMENVRIMQEVIDDLERLLQDLSNDVDCDNYGYYRSTSQGREVDQRLK